MTTIIDRRKPNRLKKLAIGIGLISFLMLVTTIILAFIHRLTFFEIIQNDFGYVLIVYTINAVVSLVLALLILFRNPRQVIGWLFLVIGFLFSWNQFSNFLLNLLDLEGIPGPVRPIIILGALAYLLPLMITLSLVPLFFPDGRLPSRRWWPVLVIVLIGIIGQTLAMGFLDVFSELPQLEYNRAESFLIWLQNVSEPIMILGILGALASLVVRFFRSHGDERTQMKWLVYTATMSIVIMLLLTILLGEESLILGIFSSSIPTFLTLAIGLAILRYHLYDIDIIIRRTLQYALLTLILGFTYFAIVILLQTSVSAITDNAYSPIIIVLSTLSIAALFNPLRIRVQDFIDRRFYRAKYDAENTLARFAATTRDQVDLESLSDAILSVVDETVRPDRISLWLRKMSKR